jgi:AraC family transcriptional regulator
MTDLYPSRIEAYENGRRVPIATRPPVLSKSVSLSEDVVLERHLTPGAAEYPEREHLAHVLYLPQPVSVRVDYRSEGKQFATQAQPGHVWIIPRGMRHSSRFEGQHGGVVLSIGMQQFEHNVNAITHGDRVELIPGFNLKDEQLTYLLLGLLTVAQGHSYADTLISDMMVNAVCIRLATCYSASKLNPVPQRGGLPLARLKKILEYIDANLDKNISLRALADAANMNLHYFATLFRKSMGMSPHQFVLNRRVERAKGLLGDRNRSILDVSLQVGFDRPNNFARAFRRVAGISPTDFRRDYL